MSNNTISEAAAQLEKELHQSGTAANADPQAMQQLKVSLDSLRHSAAALDQQGGGAQTQSLLQTIANDTGIVLGALSMLPLPGPAPAIVKLVEALLPTVFGAAGLMWPGAAAPSAQSAQHASQQPAQAAQDAGQQSQDQPQSDRPLGPQNAGG